MGRSIALLGLFGMIMAAPPAVLAGSQPPYVYTGRLSFDIAKVPFSRYGSYLVLSRVTRENSARFEAAGATPGLYLRNVHGNQHRVFRIELLDGDTSIQFRIEASPSVLRLRSAKGTVEICIAQSDQLRFRGDGVGVRLIAEPGALAIPNGNGDWEINSLRPIEKYMLRATRGSLRMDAPWNGKINLRAVATFTPTPDDHKVEGEIDTYPSVWTPGKSALSFDDCVKQIAQEYQRWLKLMPAVPQDFGRGAELAAYVNWTSVVDPDGFLQRPSMLMSKNWMARVWSWDHCFNAMELSFKDPELAWQQLMIPFDNQQPKGALPDMISNSSREINFTKPPIQGWTLAWMMQHGGFSDTTRLAEIYGPLALWTDWFFTYRDTNGDGLPEYYHGNDSGWDNATVMMSGIPVETPDLASFLILQMDTLAEIAGRLGRDADKAKWQARSNDLLKRMLATLWKKDHFIAIRASDGAPIESETLLLYLPIILGKRLPSEVRQKLIQGLTDNSRLTSNGFATEPITSKYYEPDGYWRGPIWAPSTMILAEGLDAAGEAALARKVREQFCLMAQRSGMSENFNAISGEGLRDPAYTWTSSVYLIFAHQLLDVSK